MFKRFDWWLLVVILSLFFLGSLIIHSVAPRELSPQLFFGLISAIFFLVLAHTDYRLLSNFGWPLYLLSLALLVITLVFGYQVRGAARWLPLGPFQFQPSELVKPLLILSLASQLSSPWSNRQLLSLSLFFLLPVGLIFKQPDLGSSLVVLSSWFGMIFMAGIPVWIILTITLLTAASGPWLWHILADYQKQRLLTFINPGSDPLSSGYHAIQAMITIGSGQFWGRGLGHGTQSQLKFLPERHTDFIFASLAEELGFVAVVLLISLFGLLLWRILMIARQAPDRFGSLVCFGIFAQLLFQITINLGMNLGLTPITGITLPLVSSGGSSLIATLASLGLVASIASRRRPPDVIQFSP